MQQGNVIAGVYRSDSYHGWPYPYPNLKFKYKILIQLELYTRYIILEPQKKNQVLTGHLMSYQPHRHP